MNEGNELLFSLRKGMRTSILYQDVHGLYMEWDRIYFQPPNCSHFGVVCENSLWD